MYTVKENIVNELIINKSRFITYIYKVTNKDETDNILATLKKEYKDATHHCYAYILGNFKKASDDGEPTHTAGMPILNVLENKELNNILVVVIRYFGGIKLGAGGLVRAYSNSVSKALDNTVLVPIIKEIKFKIEFSYQNIDNVNYILKDYKITYKDFDTNIIYEFICEENKYPDNLDNYIIKKIAIQ